MEKSYKYLFFTLLLFALVLIPNKVFAAEVEQSRTINSSIGKFEHNYDSFDLSLSVNNTSMLVGSGNYYYLLDKQGVDPMRYYFRRYFTNLTTSLTNNESYHVRIVFFRQEGIDFSWYGTNGANRCLNNKVSAQNNGVNVSQLTSSITRSSSTATLNGRNFIYDRFDIYFKANQTTNNLSISIGELTSCSYMYYNNYPGTENKVMGVNGIYVWHGAADSGTNEQDMIAQQKKSNTFLGAISQKITDFTIMVHNLLQDIKDKIDDFKNAFVQHINNFKTSMENRLDDIKNFFSGSSIDETDVENFFNHLEFYDNNGLGQVVSAPFSFISSLGTDSCSPITLTAWNTSFELPCGTTLFWNRIGVWYTFWSTIFGGFLIYKLSYRLVKVVNDAVDPQKDSIGGLEV